MKVFVVLATQNFESIVDSVHRFRVNALQRRVELISEGKAQRVEIIDKILDELPEEEENE